MQGAIGQRLDSRDAAVDSSDGDWKAKLKAVPYAVRQERLRFCARDARQLMRDAERDREHAADEIGRLVADTLVASLKDDDMRAAEREIAELEEEWAEADRRVRRYALAASTLNDSSGVIRDSSGHILR